MINFYLPQFIRNMLSHKYIYDSYSDEECKQHTTISHEDLAQRHINMSINNCYNPWDCLCTECINRVVNDQDHCLNHLFIPEEEMDEKEISRRIKQTISFIKHRYGDRDQTRETAWLWRIIDGNKWYLEQDRRHTQTLKNNLEWLINNTKYKPSKIMGKMIQKRFSLLEQHETPEDTRKRKKTEETYDQHL